MNLRRARLFALVALAAIAPAAQAHLLQTGMGPFFDGLAHPLISSHQLLLLLGLALVAGQQPLSARWVLLSAPAGWLAGMACVGLFDIPAWFGILSFAVLGLLAACRLPLSASVLVLLSFLCSATTALSQGEAPQTLPVLGSLSCMLIVLSLAIATVIKLDHGWLRIALRALGSWLAAAGLLMGGWILSGKSLA